MSRRTLFTFRVASGRNVLTLLFLVLPLFSGALFTLPGKTVRAQHSSPQNREVKTEIGIVSGLQRAIFTLPLGGKIYVNLPQDLMPGGTVSGTVITEASGKTEAEKDASNTELRNYVVEIAGQKIPDAGKPFALKVPASSPLSALAIVLFDHGREAAKAELPMVLQPSASTREFRLPTFANMGGLIKVDCPCDGVVADTDYIEIAGKRLLPLAESTGSKIAFNTSDAVGPTEIEVGEHGQVVKGRLHNLSIKLSAPKTNLLKGEKTKLTVAVTGLEDLKEAVPLRLENKSPGTMTMAPSNVQELTIKPADVRPGGRFTTQRTLIGIRVGDFHIEGTVSRREEDTPPADDRVSSSPAGQPAMKETMAGQSSSAAALGYVQLISTTTNTATITWSPPPGRQWANVWMYCWKKKPFIMFNLPKLGSSPCFCTAHSPNLVIPPYPYGFESKTSYVVAVYGYTVNDSGNACGLNNYQPSLIGYTTLTTKKPPPSGNPHILIALGVLAVLVASFLRHCRT